LRLSPAALARSPAWPRGRRVPVARDPAPRGGLGNS
jgi:hypothetical protein